MLVPHNWQRTATDFILDLLYGKDDDHAYIQAPTGTGKTFAAFMIGEECPTAGVHLIIVGTRKIVKQHRQSLKDWGCKPVNDYDDCFTFVGPSQRLWQVATWQAVAAAPHKFNLGLAILFFDECHLGGAHHSRTSYRRIVEELKPKKKVHISATANVVSERLLGKRDGHQFVLKLSDAYALGLLQPINMCEVESGLTVQIAKIEQAFDKSISDIEELSDDRLAKLAVKLKAKQVVGPAIAYGQARAAKAAARAAKLVIEHRHRSMVKIYFDKHVGEQAIFYCGNIDAAQRACAHFRQMAFRQQAQVTAEAVHTAEPSHEAFIDQFVEGRVTVIFAVGMLQEGFDFPSLYLAFDCRFHRSLEKRRVARMMQRLGRLLRKSNKPHASYYYAPDLMTYYVGDRLMSFGMLTTGMILASGDDLDLTDYHATVVVPEASSVEEIELEPIEKDIEELVEPVERSPPDRTTSKPFLTKLTSRPLYAIVGVDGCAVTRTLHVSDLTGDSAAENKRVLLEMGRNGARRPPKSTPLDMALSNYIASGGTSFDPQFSDEIKATAPHWFDRSYRSKQQLRAITDKPAKGTPLYYALARYTAPSSHNYDTEFDAWVAKERPHWRESRRNPAEKILELLRIAAAGEPRPRAGTSLANALWRADKKTKAKLKKLAPHWFVVGGRRQALATNRRETR